MFIIPFMAAFFMRAAASSSLFKTSQMGKLAVGVKLLTAKEFRGSEGFLTPLEEINLADKGNADGRFLAYLGSLFPEISCYTMRNGKLATWKLTAPERSLTHDLIGNGGECKTLALLLDPIRTSFDASNSDSEMIQFVKDGKLLPPLLDFLEQIPDSRLGA